MFLLFPDGHLLSRRWRPVAWLGAVSFVCLWTVCCSRPGRLDSAFAVPQAGWDRPLQYLLVASIALPMLMAPGWLRGSFDIAVAVRWSAQIRWFLTPSRSCVAFVGGAALIDGTTGVDIPDYIFLCVLWLVPVSVGVAILRYRLYEIDVIIRKTLVYAAAGGDARGGLPRWDLTDRVGVPVRHRPIGRARGHALDPGGGRRLPAASRSHPARSRPPLLPPQRTTPLRHSKPSTPHA